MPFTSVHAGQYRTEDNYRIQRKQTTQNTAKQTTPGLVASYDTRPGNEVGSTYSIRAITLYALYKFTTHLHTYTYLVTAVTT